jgi:hypothetical protein
MVAALGDIELALSMQKGQNEGASAEAHPLDKSYSSLAADLEAVEPDSEEFELIKVREPGGRGPLESAA